MKFEAGDALTVNGSRKGIIWIVKASLPIGSIEGLDWDVYQLMDYRDGEIITIDSPLVEQELRKVELNKLFRLVLGLN